MSCNCHERRGAEALSVLGKPGTSEESEFRVNSLPSSVQTVFRMGGGAWGLAVQRAIEAGIHDVNRLTDIAFFMHHPERISNGTGRPLSPSEPSYGSMVELWKFLRSGIYPLVHKPAGPAASGGAVAEIEDRTAHSPKDKRKKTRRVEDVYALVLHQTAFSRGNDHTKYDRVTAHFVIPPNGKIIQLHPISAYLYSSNGFNARSVAVEIVGNFPNTRGRCWKSERFGCHSLSPEQIKAGRFLIKYLVDKAGLTHVLTHRQSSGSRQNDPGPDIWCQIGQWAVDTLRLRDGGPGFKIGSGNPIPNEWRNWCKGGRGEFEFQTWSRDTELEFAGTECDPLHEEPGPPAYRLPNFPAHRTELQRPHRDQLTEIRKEIVKSFDGDRPIRCVVLVGHAATWKGISKAEYCRRSVARAQGAAEELSAQLSMTGLVTKIFLESDDLNSGDSGACEPVPGVEVALFVGGRADNQPRLPNLTSRTDSTARNNRSINRRVEIWLKRPPKPKRKKGKKKKCPGCGVPPCEEPGAVCILREGDEYEGLDCWWPGKFWDSVERLDKLVKQGKARYVCDSR